MRILWSGRFITSSARRSSALDSEGGGTGDPYGGGGGMEMVSKDNWWKCSKRRSKSSCKSNSSGNSNNNNSKSNSRDFVSNSKTNNEFFPWLLQAPTKLLIKQNNDSQILISPSIIFQDEVFIGGEDENFEGALLPEDSDNVKRCLQELKKVEAEQVKIIVVWETNVPPVYINLMLLVFSVDS